MAGASQRVGDEPELGRRSAEAMHQEDAEAPAADEVAAIRLLRVRRFFFLFRWVSMHAGWSPFLLSACHSHSSSSSNFPRRRPFRFHHFVAMVNDAKPVSGQHRGDRARRLSSLGLDIRDSIPRL